MYADPDNKDDKESIILSIKNSATIGGVMTILDKTFPGWVMALLDDFSDDYPDLRKNWHKTVSETGNTALKIMIVNSLETDDKHILTRIFAEIFTKAGFQVRRKVEFIPCRKCKKAIPTKAVYDILKQQDGQSVPENWNAECLACITL